MSTETSEQAPALFPAPAPPAEQPHRLVLSPSPSTGGVDLQVFCPGPTWRCEEWAECDDCEVLDEATEDALQNGEFVHGERHEYLESNDAWSVRTGRCYVINAPDLEDAVTDATGDQLGTYLVTVSFPDDYSLKLTPVPAEAAS